MVKQLSEEGLSRGQIIEKIHKLNGVRLYQSIIGFWVRGVKTPLGNINSFDAKPSPTLAYVIGAKIGDGYGYEHKSSYSYQIGLRVNDYEFAAETERNLAKLLGQRTPYEPWWDKWNRQWCVLCYSVLLYRFLQQPLEKLRPYVEHCRDCVAAFIRAIFDNEGSISGRILTVHNTNRELLLYIQQLLDRYFDIEATGPHKGGTRKGQRFRSPTNGKIYKAKKTVYYL